MVWTLCHEREYEGCQPICTFDTCAEGIRFMEEFADRIPTRTYEMFDMDGWIRFGAYSDHAFVLYQLPHTPLVEDLVEKMKRF